MTRKQAEKRALGLYPVKMVMIGDNPKLWDENEQYREPYLKCWDDLKGAPKLRYMRTPSKNQNADHSL